MFVSKLLLAGSLFLDKIPGNFLFCLTLRATKIDAVGQISTVGGGRVCFR